jgi:hypothetical protein
MKKLVIAYVILFAFLLSPSVNAVDWWNVSFKERHDVTVNTSETRELSPFLLNITGLSVPSQNCSIDLRIVNGSNYELPTLNIVSNGTITPPVGSRWCQIAFLGNTTANLNTSFWVYDNNTLNVVPNSSYAILYAVELFDQLADGAEVNGSSRWGNGTTLDSVRFLSNSTNPAVLGTGAKGAIFNVSGSAVARQVYLNLTRNVSSPSIYARGFMMFDKVASGYRTMSLLNNTLTQGVGGGNGESSSGVKSYDDAAVGLSGTQVLGIEFKSWYKISLIMNYTFSDETYVFEAENGTVFGTNQSAGSWKTNSIGTYITSLVFDTSSGGSTSYDLKLDDLWVWNTNFTLYNTTPQKTGQGALETQVLSCDNARIYAEPNKTYILTSEITQAAGAGTCIAFSSAANNTVLDCQNNFISGGNDTTGADTGIWVDGASNVTIKNCKVRFMYWGAYFNGPGVSRTSFNHTVVNSTFDYNTLDGIYVDQLINASFLNNIISNSWNQSASVGFDFRNIDNLIVFNNTFFGNIRHAFIVGGASLNVSNNTFYNSSVYGVDFEVSSSNFSKNNISYSPNGNCLFIDDDMFNSITDNVFDFCSIAIGSNNNQFKSVDIINNIISNSTNGIAPYGVSDANISYNTITNTSRAIYFDSSSVYDANISFNIITTSVNGTSMIDNHVYSFDGTNFTNNVLTNISGIGFGLRDFYEATYVNSWFINNTVNMTSGTAGVIFSLNRGRIIGNNIFGNASRGILLWGGTGARNIFVNDTNISGTFTHDIETGFLSTSDLLNIVNSSFNTSNVNYSTKGIVNVTFYVRANVTNDTFSPIEYSFVNISNATNQTPVQFPNLITGANGLTNWILVTQFIGNNTVNTTYTPHNVTGNSSIFTNTTNFTINSTQTVLLRILSPSITSCRLIDAPGLYTLANDISEGVGFPDQASESVCIEVQSKDVVFDCAGRSISNTGSILYGIELELGNNTVQNCSINEFATSVWVNSLDATMANGDVNVSNSNLFSSTNIHPTVSRGIHYAEAGTPALSTNIVNVTINMSKVDGHAFESIQNAVGTVKNSSIFTDSAIAEYNPISVVVDGTWVFENVTINSTGGTGLQVSNSQSFVVYNSSIQGSPNNAYLSRDISMDAIVYLVNTSFNKTNTELIGGQLYSSWWVELNVSNSTSSPVDAATITIYNVSNVVEKTLTTNANGIAFSNISELIINESNLYGQYFNTTPHQFVVTKVGYATNSTQFNITSLTPSILLLLEGNTAPNVTLNAPASGSSTKYKQVNFSFTPSDDFGYLNCTLFTNETTPWAITENNQTAIENATLQYINHTFASDGRYLWNIHCSDNSTTTSINQSASNWTIYIDSTPATNIIPVAPNPANNSHTAANFVFVNFTFTEINPETCLLEWNNGTAKNYSMTRAGNACFINMTSQQSGYWNYSIYVNDTLNNLAKNGTFYVAVSRFSITAINFSVITVGTTTSYYPYEVNATYQLNNSGNTNLTAFICAANQSFVVFHDCPTTLNASQLSNVTVTFSGNATPNTYLLNLSFISNIANETERFVTISNATTGGGSGGGSGGNPTPTPNVTMPVGKFLIMPRQINADGLTYSIQTISLASNESSKCEDYTITNEWNDSIVVNAVGVGNTSDKSLLISIPSGNKFVLSVNETEAFQVCVSRNGKPKTGSYKISFEDANFTQSGVLTVTASAQFDLMDFLNTPLLVTDKSLFGTPVNLYVWEAVLAVILFAFAVWYWNKPRSSPMGV